MKAHVDQDLCIGCGLCTTLCPDVFELNEEGKAEAVNEGEVQDAIDNCPVTAISVEETAEAEEAVEETVEEVTEEAPAVKYVCNVCGYVYDPAENDGVAFEDLPDDWVCPLCGVGKDMFAAG